MRHTRSSTAVVALFVALLLAVAASAARNEQQITAMSTLSLPSKRSVSSLMTYFFDVSQPTLQLLSSVQSGRAGRTPITLTVSQSNVNPFMPVMSPAVSTGMTHNVAVTWQVFKNLAVMFERVNAINQQAPAGSPRLFPRGAVAISAAADAPQSKTDVARLIDTAEAHGLRQAWAETSPGSVMLTPHGWSTAAVADIMNVVYDSAADAVTITLDLVHDVNTISEFSSHGKQSLDAAEAHYHFVPPPGVTLDAAALLQKLEASKFAVQGLHVFAKQQFYCYTVSFTATPPGPDIPVGSFVNITISDVTWTCSGPGKKEAEPPAAAPHNPAAAPPPGGGAGQTVTVSLTGPVLGVSSSTRPSKPPPPPPTASAAAAPSGVVAAAGRQQDDDELNGSGQVASTASTDASFVATGDVWVPDATGVGWILIQIVDAGDVTLTALTVNGITGFYDVAPPNTLNLTGVPLPPPPPAGGPPVASLQLVPLKAYRRIHDPVKIIAQALDAGGKPIAGAAVSFSVIGDCFPKANSSVNYTDATGRATLVLASSEPGAVAVVAAASNGNLVPVTSNPSHIVFFDTRRYVEDREPEYDERDAPRYAATAAKKAVGTLQQLQPSSS